LSNRLNVLRKVIRDSSSLEEGALWKKRMNQQRRAMKRASENRFVKVDAVRYRAVLEIPDSIPEEFHDEFREGDAIFRQKMVNKYEKLTELKAADEKYNRDFVTVNYFTMNQRLQIYNLVRQGKMDYNTVADNFNIPVSIVPEVVKNMDWMLKNEMPDAEEELRKNRIAAHLMGRSKWGFKTVDLYGKVKQGSMIKAKKAEKIRRTVVSDGTEEDLSYFKLECSDNNNISPI